MAVCPVCEHQQDQGDECEVCGRRLAERGVPGVTVAPMADLEPTAASASAALAPEEAPPWLEPTALPASPGAVVEALEVERAPSSGPEEPRPPPPSAVCRYCRTSAAPGEVFCASCGMRLDRCRPEAEAPARRCRACGARVAEGTTCRVCGARIPSDEH